jgi:BirA family biotin operon repressor/biotin-[acetyl-CoA-carboxylase] ligase
MSGRYRVLELLADGRFRSGQWLGERLGVSRAAIWKQIRSLPELGIEVHAVRGRGYRLAVPFRPLRDELIRQSLTPELESRLDRLDVFREVDSTNEYLKRTHGEHRPYRCRVCVAEWQSAGRGRRGRRWVSPYGANLYLSLAVHSYGDVLASGGMSLVAAIAVVRALQSFGVEGLGLKWPNDILLSKRKLAGILLDVSGESGGPCDVVIGIGLNVRLPASAAGEIDQPWTDLSGCGQDIDRNTLAGRVIGELMATIDTYLEHGMNAFAADWDRLDLLSGHEVELRHDGKTLASGTAQGIDAHGALVIEQNGTSRSYHAGEISVRFGE